MSESLKTEFVKVRTKESDYFGKVEETFNDIVASRYGDQKVALKKIALAEDRICEVLINSEEKKPVALIVYKKRPNSNYKDYKIYNSLEVKTFLIVESFTSNPKQITATYSKLLERVIKIGKDAQADGVHVTVSEKVPDVMRFLQDAGFKVCNDWKDKYIEGTKEYLMSKTFMGRETLKTVEDVSTSEIGSSHGRESERKSKSWSSSTSSKERYSQGYESRGSRDYHYENRRDDRHYRSGHERTYQDHFSRSSLKRKREGERTYEEAPSKRAKKPKSITLMKKYIHMIRNGTKTVEGRVATRMFTDIQRGDLLRFFYFNNTKDDVTCEVTEATRYSTFAEMLKNEGVSKCIPEISDLNRGIDIYQRIPGYAEKERTYGVIGFKIKVVSE